MTSNRSVVGHFDKLKAAVDARFQLMATHDLFRVDVDRDALWDCYLASFPPGTNPIFQERTVHDCTCCRHYVKTIGGVVAIDDKGELMTVWDVDVPEYQPVADALAALVRSKPIDNLFLHTEATIGTDSSLSHGDDGKVKRWYHFFSRIPRRNRDSFVCTGAEVGPKQSQARADFDVFKRGLTELTREAIDTVVELIEQGSLYRGEEHLKLVREFSKEKAKFDKQRGDRDTYVWSRLSETGGALARARNTAIGTLLIDLSEGVEIDVAVKKYERVVAPLNYKRTSALVTQKMIEEARAKVAELGLTLALERRYAVAEDVRVGDVIFADRDARKKMQGDAFSDLPTKPRSAKSFDQVETISVEKFLADVVPKAETLEVMFENKHAGNLVSLVAPVHADAPTMFKWPNGFSWSYRGDVADSIKERVKRAGGNVTGDVCCRLSWSNFDDLDLHMGEPGGDHIYFGTRGRLSQCGGKLDVDMNAGDGRTREPVENIFYEHRRTMRNGTYKLHVHQWCQRESENFGFEVEIDAMGETTTLSYPKVVRGNVRVAEIIVSPDGVTVKPLLDASNATRTAWGIEMNKFHRVSMLLNSPNYWSPGEGVGNRHLMFMIDGCVSDEPARGFYNEFLREDLSPHRKVLELVGARTKVAETPHQLSGLGFSSTVRREVLVRVTGAFNRVVKVAF